MPRKPRLLLPGATYHVYYRAARGEFVFDDDFTLRFERATGLTVRDLAARSRSKSLIRGRIEFATLAVSRYGYRVFDVADLIHKHRSSITLWLNKGLFNENKPEFALRLDPLDEQISLNR